MLNPSSIFSFDSERTTAWPSFSASYIKFPGDDAVPWFSIPDSYVIRAPQRPRRAGRRRISARKRATIYSATLAGDDYLEAARVALRDREDSAARHALEVLRGLVDAALGLLNKPVLQ
jgi:hypothetical protein